MAIYLLDILGGLNTATLVALFVGGVGLRMVAYRRDWHLPKI
jgi:uncharacterized membrane protein YeiH